ncbi:hypothetical protein [uncultured Pseudacidovorax sp.]|uniref:hypothetical protein n=1 Tax=uncultured Pseudacidovorax sp. TaxID=679313 RepID=UPI0025E85637|nr:hypothetical protein [uncultured Pseudacidovorax sp.]
MIDAQTAEDRILQLLAQEDHPAMLIARNLGWRLERVYQTLVHMEAEGKVRIWIRDWPQRHLWCLN